MLVLATSVGDLFDESNHCVLHALLGEVCFFISKSCRGLEFLDYSSNT